MKLAAINAEWTGGVDRLARAIQESDRTPYGPSSINHALLRFRFEDGLELVSQSRFKRGVHLQDARILDRAKAEGRVAVHIQQEIFPLSADERERIWIEATGHDGLPYDYWQIVGYMAWMRLRPYRPYPLLQSRRDWMTCNEHVQQSLSVAVPACAGQAVMTPTRMCWVLTGKWPVREGGM